VIQSEIEQCLCACAEGLPPAMIAMDCYRF
jgi:hypothetical protein